MFTLCSEITIGGKRMGGVHDVTVKRSIYAPGATATLQVPATAVLKQQGEPPANVETARQIKPGDPVEIRLGYDGQSNVEFRGYVRHIVMQTPLRIECEDEFYATRSRTVTLPGGTTTLRDLLGLCGLDVGYAEELPLKNFNVGGKSRTTVSRVIEALGAAYGLNLFFDLDGKFHACWQGNYRTKTVRYELRRNVIDDSSLRYPDPTDRKVQVKVVSFQKDGTKKEVTEGEASGDKNRGTVVTRHFYGITDTKTLRTIAQSELLRQNSCEGSITTFLVPFAEPGMLAMIDDPVYKEKGGDYEIESVETTFSRSGARRKIELGPKLSE